jgi:putative transposase
VSANSSAINNANPNSGPGLHTPADVHHDTATQIRQQRGLVLTAAYHAHPERFVRKPPEPRALPTSSWINPPYQKETTLSNYYPAAYHSG